ncbi:MAG: CPBP family intramembrane metalloprotease [bacterium]|nr:CPBP family intramembrane metalloprotease [bacterium]
MTRRYKRRAGGIPAKAGTNRSIGEKNTGTPAHRFVGLPVFPMSQKHTEYLKPNYIELGLLILTTIFHILIESVHPLANLNFINFVAIVCWAGYVVWKAIQYKGILKYWGFRWDNFWGAFRYSLYFTIPAIALLIGYGFLTQRFPLPSTFWFICLLYPGWGIVQQFALQGLVHRNLREIIKPVFYRSLILGILFSFAHLFDLRLVILAFPIGFAFSWIYNRYPNLWALGICHGILGALVYYIVLGQDPGTEIIQFFIHPR